MEIYLLAVSLITGVGGVAFVVLYSAIANLRDPVAKASWLGGVWVILVSSASFLLMLGDERETLSRWFAAVGFTLAALVMIWKTAIVWRYVKMQRSTRRRHLEDPIDET